MANGKKKIRWINNIICRLEQMGITPKYLSTLQAFFVEDKYVTTTDWIVTSHHWEPGTIG